MIYFEYSNSKLQSAPMAPHNIAELTARSTLIPKATGRMSHTHTFVCRDHCVVLKVILWHFGLRNQYVVALLPLLLPIYNPQTPRDLGADRTVGPVRPQSDRPTLVRPFWPPLIWPWSNGPTPVWPSNLGLTFWPWSDCPTLVWWSDLGPTSVRPSDLGPTFWPWSDFLALVGLSDLGLMVRPWSDLSLTVRPWSDFLALVRLSGLGRTVRKKAK